ncbi:MAG TPA: efflux RND transporter periplasmic adaptor subunit [Bacteroidales bacterium]|nr:efflux RND transporter periplasmic adaptor subunit [Bacteroidales bacterium]
MKKRIIIAAIVVLVAVIAIIVINRVSSRKSVTNLYAVATKGQFDIIVTTTGELQAERSTDISGPDFSQTRNIRFMDIKIQDLIPEGTEVKKGDYIATLDRTSFDNTLKDELDKQTTYNQNLEVKTLDTAVTLSNLRDNIKNLGFSVEEAAITLEQSKYEPPTTIRQAEIALDKAKRSLDQAIKGYSLKVEQAKSDMRNLQRQISDQNQRVSDLQRILANFIIKAPSDGMVIYKRDRTGAKRKLGSSISPWDNVVATLPDLSTMISKTYVNEIDVSKVKQGQKVTIMVDAFPERKYTGIVTSVANIGEQLPNADAKVFEVQINLNGSDPILRPSMTTGNKIVTKTIDDVIFVPLESVQSGSDSIPFVFRKDKTKQVVLLGESNENSVIIEKGLKQGELVFLSTPEGGDKFRIQGADLVPVIREREKARKEEELRIRREAEEAAKKRAAESQMPGPGMMMFPGGAGNFRMQGGPGNFPGGQQGTQGNTRATQGNAQGGQGNFQGGPGNFQGLRDTAAMRRFFNRMKNDTAAMRRFRQFQNGMRRGTGDTSARRRTGNQQNQMNQF